MMLCGWWLVFFVGLPGVLVLILNAKVRRVRSGVTVMSVCVGRQAVCGSRTWWGLGKEKEGKRKTEGKRKCVSPRDIFPLVKK
jgi:hypothetical protein